MTPRLAAARPTRLAAGLVAAAALVATAGFTGSPARSDVDLSCPAALPTADLVDGSSVTGSTVLSGTDPSTFTGTVLGVLEDGIAPDLDMILVKVDSDSIGGQAGIWEGMSGSPVYQDGKLVGAVAYGLSTGPSTIAGLTPAAEMQKMLSPGARPTFTPAENVPVPRALASRLVATGAASSAAVGSGMHLLDVPFSVTGLSQARLARLAPLFHLGKNPVSAGTSGRTLGEEIPVQAGGSMAAAMSYGAITAAGLGTATMVCGGEVVGFGHPMNLTGPSSMTLHGARTIAIQDDPTVAGFKVANLGAPVGVVDQDRTYGLHGLLGDVPATVPSVTSHARAGGAIGVPGGEEHTGRTSVTVPDAFSQLAFTTMLALQDRAMTQTSGGSGTASWTIKGTHDGRAFQLTRQDMYADPDDISSATAIAMAEQLSELEENGVEDVRFSSVTTDSDFQLPYQKWNVTGVDVRRNHRWHPLFAGLPTGVSVDRVAALRVHLASPQLGTRTVQTQVKVPAGALGRNGTLVVTGGDGNAPVDDFYDEGFGLFDPVQVAGPGVDELLHEMRTAPHHNEVLATLRFPNAPGLASLPRTGKATLGRVVGGRVAVPVRGVR